jgi:Ca2+-binding EF-hand superfamily protein
MAYDHEQFGYISVNDLRAALDRAGHPVSEDETYWMISLADPSNTGNILFSQFKDLITEKAENENGSSEEELLEAFVAMGGQEDGDGAINAEKLIYTIKEEFEMTIDIEKLIEEIDEDGSGQIEFDEFTALLSGNKAEDEEDDD